MTWSDPPRHRKRISLSTPQTPRRVNHQTRPSTSPSRSTTPAQRRRTLQSPTPTSVARMRGLMHSQHRLPNARYRQDEGAALMVALIFILVVGILVTAALSKTGAVLQSDYLVRQQAQMHFAVDAGIERALQSFATT